MKDDTIRTKPLLTGYPLNPENFLSPPLDMGILPFWFWNGELNDQELEWQLREYLDKGVTGIFLHGRFGLKIPYLSEAWFEKVRHVVALGKRLGMDIWIYDEMNWPSGTAERKVPQTWPHLRQKYLELVVLDVAGPLFTFLEATDSRYVNTGNSRPIAAYACSAEEFESGIETLLDLTPNLSFDKIIPWEAPPGNWKLLYFLQKEADYYIDALDPESTRRFLEVTHAAYRESVGSEFGRTVPGFYTDEPAMHYYHVGQDNYVIPWSNRMFKIFRDRCGYDLKPWLPALYADMGPRTARIRYDFWNTLSAQYSETYYRQIRDWCDAHGVLFTGHLLFEEWLRAAARCEGNIFRHLEHMHLMGVDHLYPKIGTEQEPDQHVALKLGSSAAHHHNRSRLLCESMGGTYWDCTLERMKWMANWEYVLGVNLFNNHGYHYSIEGERKRDWPPSQFYHHTWWKYYRLFTEYMARLGHILSGGRHVAKICILYPLTSIWTNYTPQQRNAAGDAAEYDFYYLTDTLLRLHLDFDYLEEDILLGAEIEEGQLVLAGERYDLLILPPVTHVKQGTLDKLAAFAAGGGHLLGATLLPVACADSDTGTGTRVAELFGLDPQRVLDRFLSGETPRTRLHSCGRVHFLEGPGLHITRDKDLLRRAVEACLTADVRISAEDIFYLHRVKDDYDIYFMVNTSRSSRDKVTVSLERTGRPELWDPNTGEITPLWEYRNVEGRLEFTLDFPASEARIVVLREAAAGPHVTAANLRIETLDDNVVQGYGDTTEPVFVELNARPGPRRLTAAPKAVLPPLELGPTFDLELEDPNCVALDTWKMKMCTADEELQDYSREDVDDREWLSVTLGAWEMQLPQERAGEAYPVTLWYRTRLQIEVLPESLQLLIDGFSGRAHRLYINGHRISDPGSRSALDAEIRAVEIGATLRVGANLIAIRLEVTRRTDGILDLLKILGAFAVSEPATIGPLPTRIGIGDWTSQGFPWFSGTVAYRTELEIPAAYLDGKLFLECDCGEDVLEVQINDHPPLVRPWRPHRCEVTGLLSPGKNRFTLKVTNTLVNMLEKKTKPSGLLHQPVLRYYPRYRLAVPGTERRPEQT